MRKILGITVVVIRSSQCIVREHYIIQFQFGFSPSLLSS